ncbi:metal-dependent hydrolase [Azomonas macrocytogenes]|uniref:Inner membrane protein n=1 Tax=Azomonas macrocytogenes TaxID=69962 RepID=A0A839T6L9_AZOMA|nr:metal-dependent hydrolase [Azomonas macrocytogenes]MBB3104106.1 inner membrane protein [Azomonas macrocytogenes]
MDSITQAALGACVQGALLGRWQGRKALLYGALLGTLPDLDVLIDYGDAVANMTLHRSFSHSLLVTSGAAAVLAWLVRRFRPHPDYSAWRLFATLWLVLVTHILLDAFTGYGTQLLWPLHRTPVAWSTLFIVDPLYTLPLLAVLVIGLIKGQRQHLYSVALMLSSLYLAFTVVGKFMVEQRVEQMLASHDLHPQAVFSTPTPFNSLLWRVVLVDGDDYHEALIGWFDNSPPQSVRLPRGTQLAAALADSPQHAQLRWFTSDLLRYDEIKGQLVVTDLRLGMTGFHPFRFPLADRHNEYWQLIPHSERLPFGHVDPLRLKLLWTRIWNQDQSLPLTEWAADLHH